MHRRLPSLGFAWLVGFSCVLGCGSAAGPGKEDVTGTITLDGQPLAGADVHFIGDGFAGYGRTDADGQYMLVQGAVAGENKVVISKIDPSRIPGAGAISFSDDPESGMDYGQLEAMAAGGAVAGATNAASLKGELLPPHYSDAARTQLMYDIPEGGASDVDFNLTRQ